MNQWWRHHGVLLATLRSDFFVLVLFEAVWYINTTIEQSRIFLLEQVLLIILRIICIIIMSCTNLLSNKYLRFNSLLVNVYCLFIRRHDEAKASKFSSFIVMYGALKPAYINSNSCFKCVYIFCNSTSYLRYHCYLEFCYKARVLFNILNNLNKDVHLIVSLLVLTILLSW